MGPIAIENTLLIPCSRAAVYAFCVDAEARSEVPGQEHLLPEFLELDPERSWTEKLDGRNETVTCSYVVYPVADSTRMTVSAEYTPKGLARLLPGAKEGSYRKQEEARLAALKRAIERRARLERKA
jgi:hypothetical protein